MSKTKTFIFAGRRTTRLGRRRVAPFELVDLTARQARSVRRRGLLTLKEYAARVYRMSGDQQVAHADLRGMTLPELLDWCEEHAPAPVADEYAGRQATEEEIALFGQLLDAYDAEDFNGLRATLKALGHKAPATKAECMDLAEVILRDVFDAEEE